MVIPGVFFFSPVTKVDDGMKVPGDGVADASVFAPYCKKILPLWKLDRQEISQQKPLRERHSTGDVYFCRGSLVGSQAAGTVAQAREVSNNMRDIPEVWQRWILCVGLRDV